MIPADGEPGNAGADGLITMGVVPDEPDGDDAPAACALRDYAGISSGGAWPSGLAEITGTASADYHPESANPFLPLLPARIGPMPAMLRCYGGSAAPSEPDDPYIPIF